MVCKNICSTIFHTGCTQLELTVWPRQDSPPQTGEVQIACKQSIGSCLWWLTWKILGSSIPFVNAWNVTAGNPEWTVVSLVLEFAVLAEQIGTAKTAFAELAAATSAGWIERRKFAAANSANWIACTLWEQGKTFARGSSCPAPYGYTTGDHSRGFASAQLSNQKAFCLVLKSTNLLTLPTCHGEYAC